MYHRARRDLYSYHTARRELYSYHTARRELYSYHKARREKTQLYSYLIQLEGSKKTERVHLFKLMLKTSSKLLFQSRCTALFQAHPIGSLHQTSHKEKIFTKMYRKYECQYKEAPPNIANLAG